MGCNCSLDPTDLLNNSQRLDRFRASKYAANFILLRSSVVHQYALTFAPSLVTGRLFDLGHLRIPLLLASCLMIIGTFLTAQCTKYWHFILCQGIVIGVGVYLPLSSSVLS